MEQIKQTRNICCFFKPCSITKIFCAPIAKIKLKPVTKPKIRKDIYFFLLAKSAFKMVRIIIIKKGIHIKFIVFQLDSTIKIPAEKLPVA